VIAGGAQELSEYDLSNPAFVTDRAAAGRWLTAPRAICRGRTFDGTPTWIATRYDVARTVLTDPRFTSRPPGDSHARGLRARGMPEDLVTIFDSTLLSMDRADHERVRPLVTLAFSARRVRAMQPEIERMVGELLDAMDGDGPVDLVAAFADPLPLRVVSELLGVDEARRGQWLQWAHLFNGPIPPAPDILAPALRGMVGVVREMIAERRARPVDDLLSELVLQQQADGARITDDELVSQALLVLQAGHDSVRQLIALSVFLLLGDRDQLDLVLRGKTTWAGGLHEVMRHAAPVKHAFRRFATEPVEVDGVIVEPGEGVLVVLAAANRDPAQFEDPGRLDVTRAPNPHLGFSRGAHFCPGSALAMVQAEVALRALFERFPAMRLAAGRDEIAPSFLLGISRLPLHLA
jgi:cytochrome P450